MSTEHIVGLLIEERDRLEAAISALQGPSSASAGIYEDPTMPDWVKPKAKFAPAPKTKRKLSAAGRKRIVEATKARWARVNAAKAAAAAPVPATPKATPTKAPVAVKKKAAPAKAQVKKGSLTEAGRKALSIAMKERWAAKKKAAAKKAA
jgi:histone H1/5